MKLRIFLVIAGIPALIGAGLLCAINWYGQAECRVYAVEASRCDQP